MLLGTKVKPLKASTAYTIYKAYITIRLAPKQIATVSIVLHTTPTDYSVGVSIIPRWELACLY